MGDKSFREIYEDTRLFYRLPKKLFEDSNFKEMTCEAKILYMLLLDRLCLSRINGEDWRDEYGCVFIYFTIEEMMRLMHFGNKKINELLKELEHYELILRRHIGQGRPNKIYVYDLLQANNANWKPFAYKASIKIKEDKNYYLGEESAC